jgi:hypothetical protein
VTGEITLTGTLPSAPLLGTRQRFFLKKKFFAEYPSDWHSAMKKFLKILCRVPSAWYSAKKFFFEISLLSAPLLGPRQRNFFFENSLPSALSVWHSAKRFFKKIFAECLPP